MSEAAVYQARRRKRADLAEQWLNAMPPTTQCAWFRSRAEAAVLEARGDIDGAIGKLAETENAFRVLPANALREATLCLLERWKADLRAGRAV